MDNLRDSHPRTRKGSHNDSTHEATDERSLSPKPDSKQLQEFLMNLNKMRTGEQREAEGSELDVQNKRAELNKLRYRKVRQRLAALCYKHEEISLGKEATSSNKPRLMRLALDLERQLSNQVRDYGQVECTVRELVRLLEQKKENDLHVVRQSRLLPSLMEFFKKVPASHKNEYRESAKLLEPASRILSAYCSISINREYMILTNRVQVLASLLNWALSKKDELQDHHPRLAVSLLNILTTLLEHRLETDSNSIVQESIELIFYSQLVRRLRLQLEAAFAEDYIADETLCRTTLKFFYALLNRVDQSVDDNDLDEPPTNLSACLLLNIETLAPFLSSLMHNIIFDKDKTPRENSLPASHVAMLLLLVKILCRCCRLSLSTIQKSLLSSGSETLLGSLSYILRELKQVYQKSADLRLLLDNTIILVGYLAYQNTELPTKASEHGVLAELCDLPTVFLVDKRSIEVLMPTLCCLIYNCRSNFDKLFEETSPLHMKKFLKNQIQNLPEQNKVFRHARKSSHSSINSTNTQSSSVFLEKCWGSWGNNNNLASRFPSRLWKPLYNQLDKVE